MIYTSCRLFFPWLVGACFAQDASCNDEGCSDSLLQASRIFDAAPCGSFQANFEDVDQIALSPKNEGEAGGEWSPCTHLATYGLNFPPFFARFLAFQLAPKTVLEFGCGLGTSSDSVARMAGADVTCIEPDATLGTLIASLRKDNAGNGKLRQLSVNIFEEDAKACTAELKATKHDLVFSLEVAEHIPVKFHAALIDFLKSATGKYLVFSAARPDQAGTGHLPESMFPKDVWKKTFEDAGLVYLESLTQMARNAAYPSRSYDIFGNVMVFGNPSHPDILDTDQPVEMLSEFTAYFGDSHTKEEHFGDVWRAFAAGSNAATWPTLTLLEQKAKSGTICKKSAASFVERGGNMEDLPLVEAPAFESAWAAHFYKQL